jgi:hypothetical protein
MASWEIPGTLLGFMGFHGIYSEYNRRLKHGKLGVPEIMGFVPVKSSLDG